MAREPEDERTNEWGRIPNEYGRVLGRIEESLHELKDSSKARDIKLEGLTDRVRENAQQAQTTALALTGRVDLLQNAAQRTEAKLDDTNRKVDTIGERVGALEEPMRRALAQKNVRRKILIKIVSTAAAIGIFASAVFEPIWKALAPTIVQRWMSGQ